MIYANNTHKKTCALGLILKVRVFGTRKWPISAFSVRVSTHANVRQVESLIRDFSNAGRHEHSFISATGIKSRTDLAQAAERSKKSRPGGLARVCINTFVNGLYKQCYAFLFYTKWLRKCIQVMPCTNPKRLFGWLSSSKECFFLIKRAWKCASLWFVGSV